MKDKDIQSDEFERMLIVTQLRGLKEDINVCVDCARGIANEHIQRGTGGREVALAITNLQQARQWVEEAVKELGAL